MKVFERGSLEHLMGTLADGGMTLAVGYEDLGEDDYSVCIAFADGGGVRCV